MWSFWTAETIVLALGLNFVNAAHALGCGEHVTLFGLTDPINGKMASDMWLLLLVAVTIVLGAVGSKQPKHRYSKYLSYRYLSILMMCILRLMLSLDWISGCVHSIPVIYMSIAIPFRLTEHVTSVYLTKTN